MAGAYCQFCCRRCFVDRVLPDLSWSGHMATCSGGMEHDRKATGHDHTTALNLTSPVPDGLHLTRHSDDGDVWRVVHTASGKHVSLIDWPAPGVPHRYARFAAASLAASGIDWTRAAGDLVDDLRRVADAARAASTAAYDAAVHAGDRVDDRPAPFTLAARRRGTSNPSPAVRHG